MSGDRKISEGKVSSRHCLNIGKCQRWGVLFDRCGCDNNCLIWICAGGSWFICHICICAGGSRFHNFCIFSTPVFTWRPERLISGINQLCPSCLGDLQSLSEKYLQSNDFLWAIFPNICKYLSKKFDNFGAQKNMWVGAGVEDWIRGVKGLGKIQFL